MDGPLMWETPPFPPRDCHDLRYCIWLIPPSPFSLFLFSRSMFLIHSPQFAVFCCPCFCTHTTNRIACLLAYLLSLLYCWFGLKLLAFNCCIQHHTPFTRALSHTHTHMPIYTSSRTRCCWSGVFIFVLVRTRFNSAPWICTSDAFSHP
ncbi:hypothetical protein B0J18DRAFT_121869 [Chaetomium sp. MPI-SDFR-AT-0129]|nr:hypothetical protein B0J18DRAFT_121869 [Chaetomium sp. MPI-SDFR-AT-0129]